MRVKKLYLIFLLGAICTSCVLPVNLNYETADLLDPGDVELSASVSMPYAVPNQIQYDDSSRFELSDLSYGGRIMIGTGKESNIGLRFETTAITKEQRQYFGEIQFKFPVRTGRDSSFTLRKMAFGFPIQFYGYENYQAIGVNPRLYWTFLADRPNFNFTVIPKAHFIIPLEPDPYPLIAFGVTVNCTLSTNSSKWAFRPEVGNLGRSIGFGGAFVLRL